MTVYIDDMYLYPMGEYKSASGRVYKMSHMIADTTEELIGAARGIGMRPNWIQRPGTPREHFDVVKARREQAIANGAVAITMRECSAMCARRRVTGQLGQPGDAETWRAELAAQRSDA